MTGDPAQLFTTADSTFDVESAVGARLNLFTPIEGLVFGASVYDGSQTVPNLGLVSYTDQSYLVYGAHLEYLSDKWSIRSEVSAFEVDSGRLLEADGFYAEAAYRFGDHWQVAARYDDFNVTAIPIDLSMFPPFAQQFLGSEDLAVGLNYWLSPELVIRLNFHLVEGNRFAFPDDQASAQQALFTGLLEDETELLIFGAQFSF